MSHFNQLLDVALTEDRVEISIGRKHLIQYLSDSDRWPTHDSGRPLKVLNEEEFLEEFCNMLMQESENGATLLHDAFEDAAEEVFESGSESIEEERSLSSSDFYYDDEEDYDADNFDEERFDNSEWN